MSITTHAGTSQHGRRRGPRSLTWIFELLVAVTVAPALIHAVVSLNELPIV